MIFQIIILTIKMNIYRIIFCFFSFCAGVKVLQPVETIDANLISYLHNFTTKKYYILHVFLTQNVNPNSSKLTQIFIKKIIRLLMRNDIDVILLLYRQYIRRLLFYKLYLW